MPKPASAVDIVEQAVNGLDDQLKPTDEHVELTPEKPTVPEVPVEETAEEGKSVKDGAPSDEGFTADEVEAGEEPTKPEVEVAPLDTSGLNPEAKFIFDNLPQITTRIKEGENTKSVQVKSWAQLPEDVEFATKRDELAFINAITAQENRAQDLQGRYQQSQRENDAKTLNEKEEAANMADIAELQREGLMAKFKGSRTDPEFKDDDAAKEVEDILEYMRKQNAKYLEGYQQGKPMRYIGFREAFLLRQAGSTDKRTAPERKEDDERQEVARKTQGTRGLAVSEIKKPAYKSGQIRTRQQLLDSIEELL